MCKGSKSKEVTSEDIKKLSIRKITNSNLFYFPGCFFFKMGREFKENNLSLVLFNRLKILHIIPVGLISKKVNNLACAAHFFVHFFDVVSHNYNMEIPSYASYMYVANVVCAHQKFCCLCSCSFLFFLLLIFTLVAASISLSVTANFHVFLPTKFVSFSRIFR